MKNIKNSIKAALCTSLMIAGAYIAIPLPGPVPIVLSNFFVLLAGLLLGPVWGVCSVGLYLFLGAIGLPVFSAGGAGIAHFAGPTGGYLLGYLGAAFVSGLISRSWRPQRTDAEKHRIRYLFFDLCAASAGGMVIYLCGVPWLRAVLDISWAGAIAAGMLPIFLIGDAIKIIAAAAAADIVRMAKPDSVRSTE